VAALVEGWCCNAISMLGDVSWNDFSLVKGLRVKQGCAVMLVA